MLDGAHAESDDEHGTLVTRFLSSTTSWLGSVPAILLAAGVVLAWLIGGLWVPRHWGNDTYQLLIGTVTTVVTFAMVFIIQNSQNRDGKALQAKLDAQNEVLFSIAAKLGEGDEAQRLLKLVGLENAPERRIRQHHADVYEAVQDRSRAWLRPAVQRPGRVTRSSGDTGPGEAVHERVDVDSQSRARSR